MLVKATNDTTHPEERMGIQQQREDIFTRSLGLEVDTRQVLANATRNVECTAALILQEAFPEQHFVTSDGCLMMPPSQRFRIGCSWWSDRNQKLVVSLEAADGSEVVVDQRELLHLLRLGQVVPVGGP
jgi:hypothetical protein